MHCLSTNAHLTVIESPALAPVRVHGRRVPLRKHAPHLFHDSSSGLCALACAVTDERCQRLDILPRANALPSYLFNSMRRVTVLLNLSRDLFWTLRPNSKISGAAGCPAHRRAMRCFIGLPSPQGCTSMCGVMVCGRWVCHQQQCHNGRTVSLVSSVLNPRIPTLCFTVTTHTRLA